MAKSKGRTVAQSGKTTAKKSTRESQPSFEEAVEVFRQLSSGIETDDVPVMADLAIWASEVAPESGIDYPLLGIDTNNSPYSSGYVITSPREVLAEAKSKLEDDTENVVMAAYDYDPKVRDRAVRMMGEYLGAIQGHKKFIEGEYKDARSSLLGVLQQKAAATEAAVEQEAKNMEDALFENPSLSPSMKKRALSAAAMLDKMPKSATITQSMLNDVWRFVTGTTPKRKR